MMELVTGGSGSGKSAYAEEALCGPVSFPDSLVSLVDMDVGAIEGMIQQLNDTLWQLTLTQDKQYEERASALLDELAPYYIYFQQFRLD